MAQLKVAFCDDEEIVINATKGVVDNIVRENNIEIEKHDFTSPALLIEYCKNNPIDLVFLDIEMPEMNGIDTGRAIKDVNEEIEIVFVSNKEDQVFNALRLRPFGFVRKSEFFKDLNDVLKSYLKKIKKEKTDNEGGGTA